MIRTVALSRRQPTAKSKALIGGIYLGKVFMWPGRGARQPPQNRSDSEQQRRAAANL
jgi:hypothetical protein